MTGRRNAADAVSGSPWAGEYAAVLRITDMRTDALAGGTSHLIAAGAVRRAALLVSLLLGQC